MTEIEQRTINTKQKEDEPSDGKVELLVTLSSGETRCLRVRGGSPLERVALKNRLPLEFDCRKADCGICLVRVATGSEGLSAPTAAERDFLQAMHASPDERLACQCRVLGACHIFLDDDPLPLEPLSLIE